MHYNQTKTVQKLKRLSFLQWCKFEKTTSSKSQVYVTKLVKICIQKHIRKNIFLNLGRLGIFQVLATFFNLSFPKILEVPSI